MRYSRCTRTRTPRVMAFDVPDLPMSPSYPTVPAGLCADCRHARVVPSDRGSAFVRCRLADTDQRFSKYPVLPVLACPGYEPVRLMARPARRDAAPDEDR